MTKRMLAVGLLGAAFAAASTPALADRDAVQFGSDIHVAPGASVHDAVCFFCSVNAEGEVQGDIVVFFGNIHIADKANHDVVNFFGQITAEDNASVGQDMVSFFGLVRLGKSVSVGKDLVVMFGGARAAESVTVGGDRVVQPGWVFFGPLIFVVLIILLILHEYRAYRRRVILRGYNYPPKL